jgi:hypothetical protein
MSAKDLAMPPPATPDEVVAGADKLKLVLCWHMHQPEYRDLYAGEFKLPWTYLHVIKDYVDMAAHLEAVPKARAVVNFAPILLEQIEEYARQVDAFFHNRAPLTDPLLAALVDTSVPDDYEDEAFWHQVNSNVNQFLQIPGFDYEEERVFLHEFIKGLPDIRLKSLLEKTFAGKNSFGKVEEILSFYPDELET